MACIRRRFGERMVEMWGGMDGPIDHDLRSRAYVTMIPI